MQGTWNRRNRRPLPPRSEFHRHRRRPEARPLLRLLPPCSSLPIPQDPLPRPKCCSIRPSHSLRECRRLQARRLELGRRLTRLRSSGARRPCLLPSQPCRHRSCLPRSRSRRCRCPPTGQRRVRPTPCLRRHRRPHSSRPKGGIPQAEPDTAPRKTTPERGALLGPFACDRAGGPAIPCSNNFGSSHVPGRPNSDQRCAST